jgi:hypothetical protein
MANYLNDISPLFNGLSLGATMTSSTNGTSIDCIDTDGRMQAVCAVGTLTGTTPTVAFTFEESDTGSGSWTAVTNVVASGGTVSAANTIRLFSFDRTKRYVRAVATVAGTTPSGSVSAVLIAEKKTY